MVVVSSQPIRVAVATTARSSNNRIFAHAMSTAASPSSDLNSHRRRRQQQQSQQRQLIGRRNFMTVKSSFSLRSSVSPSTSNMATTNNNKRMQIRCLSSSGKADFYKTLGVPKGADKATIKKSYFQMAKKYHPDANQGDDSAADKFKEVTEAYEVLSDDKQRELYDTYGHAGVDPNSGFGGGGGGNPFGQGGGNPFGQGGGNPFGDGSFHFESGPGGQINPEDLFDAFFGGGQRRQRGPRRGADLQMHIELSFRDAVFGSKQDLNLRYQVRDPATGGAEIKERSVECDVPAGIDSGMNLRLAGQGAEGDPGAPRGDLMVTVIVQEDDYFQRDGADVHVEVPISVTQAILGGTVDVKTLTGVVEMKIPKGCQPESKLVMRGKGIPILNRRSGQKGNQIAHLRIEIPKKITKRQEELMREFDEESKEHGLGISGRLAKAAGSAFETFFGTSSKDEKSVDEGKSHSTSSSSSSDSTSDDTSKEESVDTEEKKQQAS